MPDFPCLAVEIAELRPDMNIKVAAFTENEKSMNIWMVPQTINNRLFQLPLILIVP